MLCSWPFPSPALGLVVVLWSLVMSHSSSQSFSRESGLHLLFFLHPPFLRRAVRAPFTQNLVSTTRGSSWLPGILLAGLWEKHLHSFSLGVSYLKITFLTQHCSWIKTLQLSVNSSQAFPPPTPDTTDGDQSPSFYTWIWIENKDSKFIRGFNLYRVPLEQQNGTEESFQWEAGDIGLLLSFGS